MQWVSDAAEKIYIHHSRARKGSYFSKREATELLPRGITRRAQQPAIHQMPVLGVKKKEKKKKKEGFMSEIKCCWFVLLRGRATNRDTTVSSFEDPQLLTCQTYKGFQKRLFTPEYFPRIVSLHGRLILLWKDLCCLSCGTETSLKPIAICSHLEVWLLFGAHWQEQLKFNSTEHREFKILQRHRASQSWHMVHNSGCIDLIIIL